MFHLRVTGNTINPKKILKQKGIEPKGKAMKIVMSELERLSKKLIPEQKKSLKTRVMVTGEYIHYRVPYAQYQWYGKVMVGRAPKKVTNKDLKYQRGRESKWALKTWEKEKNNIIKTVEREYSE